MIRMQNAEECMSLLGASHLECNVSLHGGPFRVGAPTWGEAWKLAKTARSIKQT